jgi:hypothetical protein
LFGCSWCRLAAAVVERVPLWNDRTADPGPFDIIGGVHGCADEPAQLLERLGYGKGVAAEHEPVWGTVALPTDRPKRLTPTGVTQFVRLEQCERFLRFRLSERANQKFMGRYDVTAQAPGQRVEAGQAVEHQSRPGVRAEKGAGPVDGLAAAHPEWVRGVREPSGQNRQTVPAGGRGFRPAVAHSGCTWPPAVP